MPNYLDFAGLQAYDTAIKNWTNNKLSDYVLSSDLSTILNNYVTNTSLSTTLSNYVTNSSLSTTLSNYVTNSNLSTTLNNYVTNSGLTTTLASYVTDSELATELSNYTTTVNLTTVLGNKLIPAGGTTGQVLVKNSNSDRDIVWDDIDGEYYLESSVTTTTGQPFSFTFTDAKLVPGAIIEIYAGQLNQTGTQTVYDYSDVTLSSGLCTISYPDAPSNATVTCRIYIK